MNRTGRVLAGLALLALGVGGARYAAQAARAHALYHHAKYGEWRQRPDLGLAAVEGAYALYPHNFYLCAWAAETAWYAPWPDGIAVPSNRLELATTWCRRGLALNPLYGRLRLIEAELLAVRELPEAIRRWEAYVDWHFWDPENHLTLISLYGRAGRYEQAFASLAMIAGMPQEAEARAALREAWAREIRAVSETRPTRPAALGSP